MKADLHVHFRSYDNAVASAKMALKNGIHIIGLLDHNRQPSIGECEAVEGDAPGIFCWRGVELDVYDVFGVRDHLVIISENDIPPFDGEKRQVKVEDLANYFEGMDYFSFLAHPFRRHGNIVFDFQRFLPDGVEVYSRNTPKEYRKAIEATAKRYGLVRLATSDAHRARHVGYGHIEVQCKATTALDQQLEVRTALSLKRDRTTRFNMALREKRNETIRLHETN